jgi:recombination protein RecR
MSGYSHTIENLIEQLAKLPGIGSRTAERLAFHLLKASEAEAMGLATAIHDVKTKIRPCARCFNLAEDELCAICQDMARDQGLVAVVEQPKDLLSLEATGSYRGAYHVLMGHVAPLEGIGAEDLTIDELVARVQSGQVREVILATNPTVAGDATALVIHDKLDAMGVKVTRLARGLSSGSQIEYVNRSVLSDAINDRRDF